jgi:ribonuclease HI
MDHLFLGCPFAQQCWTFVLGKLQYYTPLPNKLWDLFQAWPELYSNSIFSALWTSTPTLIVWVIWWERNKRIFHKETTPIQAVLQKLEKSISEVVNSSHAKLKCNLRLTWWDSVVIREWKYIYVPTGWCHQSTNAKIIERHLVHWIPPAQGFVKINFDGSSRGNPGDSGASVCIRDNQGAVLAIKSCSLPRGTNNMAEAHGLLAGLSLARKGGFQRVQIEGDSLVIINACIKRDIHNWQLAYILQQVWILLDSIQEVYISHTLREGNAVADHLANMGCNGKEMTSFLPEEIINLDPKLHQLIVQDGMWMGF